MNIGEAAARSGLPSKTLRYYEDIGLVVPETRRANGYRDYGENEVHRLVFVQRARSLGFTVQACRELLDLYDDRTRASADVKALALHRIEDIEQKIAELQTMKQVLEDLARRCHGDDRPDCPILESFAGSDQTMLRADRVAPRGSRSGRH